MLKLYLTFIILFSSPSSFFSFVTSPLSIRCTKSLSGSRTSLSFFLYPSLPVLSLLYYLILSFPSSPIAPCPFSPLLYASFTSSRHPSVEDLVRAAYPSHPWDHSKFVHKAGAGSVFTPQLFMERIIRSVFPPGVKIESNARAVHGIVNATGFPLEIDVYLPQYKLGFEYQVSSSSVCFCCSFLFLLFSIYLPSPPLVLFSSLLVFSIFLM